MPQPFLAHFSSLKPTGSSHHVSNNAKLQKIAAVRRSSTDGQGTLNPTATLHENLKRLYPMVPVSSHTDVMATSSTAPRSITYRPSPEKANCLPSPLSIYSSSTPIQDKPWFPYFSFIKR